MPIPVYVFTGFLDAGKTKFIQETLEDPRFNAGERTLLLAFEEGEEEYDLSPFPKKNVYLEVLDQKSQRLKTLTEDLVEASRASSGNIKLEITNIDFVALVQQTTGEFEEKYAIRHLEIVNTLPNEVIMIEADGRRLWRVLENLYNNAFKYALEGTRVYVTIEDHGADVVFTIKNVSANPLNISPDELTERFVRGDVSRTTEGSGLGLSIAKSLTQLMGGIFFIGVDGDLFKASITFPLYRETQQENDIDE